MLISGSASALPTGSGRGLPGHRAHPGEQGSQDAPAYVPRPRPHQPVHELAVPHRDDPHREGADRAQARGGSDAEEKGKGLDTCGAVLVNYLGHLLD